MWTENYYNNTHPRGGFAFLICSHVIQCGTKGEHKSGTKREQTGNKCSNGTILEQIGNKCAA